ncbi:hypothetical protein V1460_29960 [Streptomyces sp. SCSIO 30461]
MATNEPVEAQARRYHEAPRGLFDERAFSWSGGPLPEWSGQ